MNKNFPDIDDPGTIPLNLDESAFEVIYRENALPLYDYANSKIRDADAAEEIIQDLFVSLWEKRDELRITNISGYLFVAVRNRVVDYFKQKLFSNLEVADATFDPQYPVFLDELEEQLHRAVDSLPHKTREIFILNRIQRKPAGEIAAALNLPKRTVEYHITQALRQLKVSLRDLAGISFFFVFSM